MSLTDYRKIVMIEGANRWIGVECTDGATVTLMIDAMSGYAPKLDIDEVNALIDALKGAVAVMRK